MENTHEHQNQGGNLKKVNTCMPNEEKKWLLNFWISTCANLQQEAQYSSVWIFCMKVTIKIKNGNKYTFNF